MPPSSAASPALKRRAVLVASLAFMVVGTGSIYFLVVALKLISGEFHWPRAIPSAAYALQYFGGGVGGIFMGYCLDRYGMKAPALAAATMIGGGAICTSYITNQWQLYLIYGVMMGFLGRAALFSPLTANITRWFEHKRSMAVGIVGSGQALAGALWPPVFQRFFDAVGWRETALWYGVFALATMLPLVPILAMRPPAPATTTTPGRPVAPARARAAVTPGQMQIDLCFASIGCCVAMSLPLAHLVSHVSDLGFPAARGAEVLALMLAAGAAGSFFGVGYLGERYGGLRAILVFSTAQALFLLALAFVEDLTALYLAGILFGLGYGGILPCYPVIVREYLPPAEAGRRTGVVILFAGGGMALGSWIGGAAFDQTGSYRAAFLLGVAFNLANLLMIGSLILRTGPNPRRAKA